MPVDPQIRALLDRGTGVPATHTLPVAEARRQYEARIALMAPPPRVAKFVERCIDGPGGPLKNPYASPLRARDLTRLLPAYVISAELDPLRDAAELYGMRLRAAGVPTEITRHTGINHGFLFWVGVVAGADAAIAETCAWARQAFRNAHYARSTNQRDRTSRP